MYIVPVHILIMTYKNTNLLLSISWFNAPAAAVATVVVLR